MNDKEKEILIDELMKLKGWFTWYDRQCNEYRRCLDLGIEYDEDIMALHQEAEMKAARINEIRTELQT